MAGSLDALSVKELKEYCRQRGHTDFSACVEKAHLVDLARSLDAARSGAGPSAAGATEPPSPDPAKRKTSGVSGPEGWKALQRAAKTLGVKPDATDEDVRSAYKYQAKMHHPDRNRGASTDRQKKAEERFKAASEAMEMFTAVPAAKRAAAVLAAKRSDERDEKREKRRSEKAAAAAQAAEEAATRAAEEAEAAKRRAENELLSVQQQLDFAKDDARRVEQRAEALAEQGERARAALDEARARLTAAEEARGAAEAEADRLRAASAEVASRHHEASLRSRELQLQAERAAAGEAERAEEVAQLHLERRPSPPHLPHLPHLHHLPSPPPPPSAGRPAQAARWSPRRGAHATRRASRRGAP